MPAHQTKKAVYRIRNWREYNQALVRRGSLTVWVDQESLDAWNHQGPAQWGGQYVYSDAAIQCVLTLRAVFHLPLRATQGMAASVFDLMGLDLEVPHLQHPVPAGRRLGGGPLPEVQGAVAPGPGQHRAEGLR